MRVAVASGKGGTGKTTIATNLALAVGSHVHLLDCDVEEPNAHFFINPVFEATQTVFTPVPEVDEERCTFCGKCSEICQFKAIAVVAKTVLVFNELCHSCGGCLQICPENAITEKGRELGIIQKGHRNGIEFIHGKLKIGEGMSPPLIKEVRTYEHPDELTIIDAPPGTSCPVIASIKDTDFVLLVTEPTPFGLYDLKLAVAAVEALDIPCGLVINRCDIGDDKVKEYAAEINMTILMEIPFDRRIAEAYSRGDPLVEMMPEWKGKFLDLYHRINLMRK